MKYYRRVMLGRKSIYAEKCFAENFIGTDFDIGMDLTNKLPDDWRVFNKEFIPVYLARHPDKTKIGAGLACGMLWTVSKGINTGDIVLCPDGKGHYRVAEVTGDYIYMPASILPHARPVRWYNQIIDRESMSEALKKSAGSSGTVSDISRYREEIEQLIGVSPAAPFSATNETNYDPAVFAMEKYLEEFLITNWSQTELGKEYDIYEEDGEIGRQYPTDTGRIDLLAISKDKKTLLVVELKKDRASDAAVGQTLRYMGYVQGELAEEGQSVKGVVIALEDDQKIRRALAIVPSISFYRYQVNFKLMKA